MKITRVIAYTIIAASVGLSALHAKSLREGVTPAEFPPASYKGQQYVDSKGCIYIRAGIDGNVTWVPRVSRKRQQICGYKPSLTAAQIASAPIAKPVGAAPIQITVAPSASAPARPAQVSAPAKPKTSNTAPAPVATVTPTPKPAPVAVAAAPAKPAQQTPRAAPKPLVFVNPPPERVAAATVPATPTTTSKAKPNTPRPAPEPLVFVNPPPKRVAAATVPPATPTTTNTAKPNTPRRASKPLLFVNPPPEQVAASSTPAAPTTTTAPRPNQQHAPRPEPQPLIFVNTPDVKTTTSTTVATNTRQPRALSQPPAPPAGWGGSFGTCPDASAFSQQYINSDAKYPVRCGPQVTSAGAENRLATTAQPETIDPNTRIVPRHVYENRQNVENVRVAKGYQNVWKDGRLNPRRAERTARPANVRVPSQAPRGYKAAWDDDRLNTARAAVPTAGDAQMNGIWTQTLPRRLIVSPVPKNKQIVVLSSRNSNGSSEQAVARTSTRSSPKATSQTAGKPKYIRVATYDSDAGARTAAQNLARSGLPMRLGTVTRKGKAYRVVLAGPFTSNDQAKAALAKVRGAGFSKAKITK
jgi:cell division septation protein DedD